MDTVCSSDFVEEFIDTNDFLANEMQLKITNYLNMDFDSQSRLSDALNSAHNVLQITDPTERKKALRQLMCILHGFQDINNEKELLVSDMQHLVDEKAHFLDIHRKRITSGDDSDDALDNEHKISELKSNDSESRSRISNNKRKCTRFKVDRSSRIQNNNKNKFSLMSRQQENRLKTPARQTKSVNSKKTLPPSGRKTNITSSSIKSRRKDNQNNKDYCDDVSGRKANFAAGVSNRNDNPRNSNDPLYCTCNKESFGDMIACDNDNCPIEWFHFNCVGVHSRPKGKWYCPKCRLGDSAKLKRPEA